MPKASEMQPAPEAVVFESLQTSPEPQHYSAHLPIAAVHPGETSARGLRVVAGYRRHLDFDRANQPGQDFCAFRADDRHSVAVVCDGVSQSFFGDLAASVLGRALLTVLWERRGKPPTGDELERRLKTCEGTVSDLVRTKRLSASLSPLLRSALEETRAKGSQSVFGALLLDTIAESGWLFLLGDVEAEIVHVNGQHVVHRARQQGRWSSIAGLKGTIQVERVDTVAMAMLRSDGVDETWGSDPAQVVNKVAFVERASAWARKDDVSFVWLSTRDHPRAESATRPRSEQQPSPVVRTTSPARQLQPTPPKPRPARRRPRLHTPSFLLGMAAATLVGVLAQFLLAPASRLSAHLWPSSSPAVRGSKLPLSLARAASERPALPAQPPLPPGTAHVAILRSSPCDPPLRYCVQHLAACEVGRAGALLLAGPSTKTARTRAKDRAAARARDDDCTPPSPVLTKHERARSRQ